MTLEDFLKDHQKAMEILDEYRRICGQGGNTRDRYNEVNRKIFGRLPGFDKPFEKKKGWGREIWLANNPLFCMKILELEKHKKCSVHYHEIKTESLAVFSGAVQFGTYPPDVSSYPDRRVNEIVIPLNVMNVLPYVPHQFYGLERSAILEVSTQHFEEDSHRLEPGDY